MGNENQTLDKTYTSSENSSFDANGIDLQILLPENDIQNPYSFKIFDISQTVSGLQQNALFIYMKKETDDASDLSSYDDDKLECGFACSYADITPIDIFAECTSFDPSADNALVIVYHDASDEKGYPQACAEAAFANVPDFANTVAVNGNYQTELNLMGTGPRRAGMSSFPKR